MSAGSAAPAPGAASRGRNVKGRSDRDLHDSLPSRRSRGKQVGQSRTAPALVVAVDGPGGSGKSTVAREVARRLGLRYLDTGAMYRALTWLALDRRVRGEDGGAPAPRARQVRLKTASDPDQPP